MGLEPKLGHLDPRSGQVGAGEPDELVGLAGQAFEPGPPVVRIEQQVLERILRGCHESGEPVEGRART
jgi:hypothetical protein